MADSGIVQISGDVRIERKLQRLGSDEARSSAWETGGILGSQLYREHFARLHNSRHRGVGAGFYAEASDLSFHRPSSNGVYLGTKKRGVRQRYYGGPITPRKRYLTIPIHPAAYGKRAGDSSLGDLFFVRPEGGGLYLAGQAGPGTLIFYYMLVTGVDQPADPSVLPTPAEQLNAVKRGIRQRYKTLMETPA